MTKGETRLNLQPELPVFMGHKPSEVVVDLSGQPYRSTIHAFTPGDDEVYLLVRCRVGKSTISPPGEGGETMRQTLTAISGYPVESGYGAERLEQLAIAHERREDQAQRDRGKPVAGKVDFGPDDDRLADLGDAPHEFLRAVMPGEDPDVCHMPSCGRPPTDPIHHVDQDQEPPTDG